MDLDGEEEEDQEYYGAGMENVLASAGIITSPTLPPPDHGPIDHTGVGVHVSGVSTTPTVVEDSLWGDPLEEMNKRQKKKDEEEVLLCNFHGKVCSRGICKVYEKQLREQRKKLKETQEPQNWRNGTNGPDSGRGGRGGRGGARGTRGILLRGRGGFLRDSGPRSPRDENKAPKKPNGVTSPRNAWPKPDNNPKANGDRGANKNAWSPSEMGESAKPVEESNSNPDVKDNGKDNGNDDGRPWNAPAAKDWSQSEIGGGSQAGPRPGPEGAGSKPNNKDPGLGDTPDPNPSGQEVRLKSPVKSAWGNAGGAKDWTPSELGLEDSVSQRGGGFRTPPNREPGKKSWADLVEDGDEMEYTNGDELAPVVAPAPDIEGGGDGGDEGWVESGKSKSKGKGEGKGRGKAKSATGWSDVTNQGFW
ncbi:hypothetical protein BDM02DRAFT_1459447 [Thelephora ganbajun]|uniref:Uncharacterized protein n=1 Tax=Thelephora ganbajun TaxID=370292 RepID=A0ACB6ZL83_THEGA|nr:hypothetical protein BDM02DRAFT_1459447 [Thelephora ganbajun]